MDVTRVVFYSMGSAKRPLASCSVVLDDELRLNDVQLFRGENGYFLTFPSKQDVYQDVSAINADLNIEFPRNLLSSKGGKKRYEEFYHPLSCELYKKVLSAVVAGYENS